MEQASIDSLASEVRALREAVKTPSESRLAKAIHVLEKLVIPVMLGVVAWVGNNAATEISKGQLALAQSGAESQRAEFRRNMQAKFIEIFYKDLNSGDQKSQLNAVRLVRLADPELAQSLLDLVPVTPGVSETVVAKANEARSDIATLAPLQGYRIGIYFYKTDPQSKPVVDSLQERIRKAGFTGVIQPFPSDDAFFAKPLNHVSTLEVRYEEGIEDDAADALLHIVQQSGDRTTWRKKLIPTHSPNFLSIFVPRGG